MKSNPIVCTIKAQIQAMTHWKMTIFTAHGPPSSLLIEAIAATQGVYNKQNIKSDNAPRGVSIVIKDSVPLNNTESVETTLSLAINPAMSDVEILQSPKPKGLKIGAMNPATIARILSCELETKSNLKLKLCKNQMTIEAIKIISKALCKKSLAFSHNNWKVVFALGIR